MPAWHARLATMAACTAPGVLVRIGGIHLPPPLAILVFGGAVMAAAFMLASAAEAAELDAPPGIAVAGVALVAVLPEYVIEIYFAFSGHVEFVTASLTGSTRLLLSFAVGMPAIASLILVRRGGKRLGVVELAPQKRVDLGIIGAASAYAPLIVLRGHLAWPDAIILLSLYALYLRRVSTGSPEPPHLVGIAAELGRLPQRERRRWVGGIMVFSAVAVLITAEPFADAVLLTGTTVGVSPYLLVQWLVPLATEMPELVVAFVLIQHERAGQAVAVLLSSAVSQWTLALGTLPARLRRGRRVGAAPAARPRAGRAAAHHGPGVPGRGRPRHAPAAAPRRGPDARALRRAARPTDPAHPRCADDRLPGPCGQHPGVGALGDPDARPLASGGRAVAPRRGSRHIQPGR
jgi:cation:H+ antiporter